MRARAAGRIARVTSVTALLLAGLASCSRTPRLVPASADSTSAIPSDSSALYVQMARDRWQSGDDSGEVADEGAEAGKAQRLAAVFLGNGQPFAFVWARAPGATSWRLAQSLGTDSL